MKHAGLWVAGGLVALGFGWLVWPTFYSYDHLMLGKGSSFPVRIHRLTGEAEVLYNAKDGWQKKDSWRDRAVQVFPSP